MIHRNLRSPILNIALAPLACCLPPGYQVTTGPEQDTTKDDGRQVAGKRVIRLGNVSVPQISLYLPPAEQRNGSAVVICPGGGFSILAWDLEGTEVAEWLNGLGVTAAVVKYRVPIRNHEPRWQPPAQDAQRAISLVRSKADEWGLSPERIGVLGFSAGGATAAHTALAAGNREYEAIDKLDDTSCRADFAVLVYPAYLVDNDGKQLKDDVKVTAEAPPTFFVHAFDDRVRPENSLLLAAALKKVNVPAEVHVYAAGGHGYGLRETDQPVTTWPAHCEAWLKQRGLLNRVEK